MKTRINPKNGDRLSILGFGCMRLPEKDGAADEQRSVALIRRAVDAGVNYFDTAYVYQKGKNEAVLGKALSNGLREKVFIATKLPPYMVHRLQSAKRIFASQLERLRTSYIDYYLLHMLVDRAMLDRLSSLGVMAWLEELKAEGTIRSIGFSFHGTGPDFQALLKAWPWDFCQVQYNYLDENNQAGRAGLLLAESLGVPVIVMEPLRGGKLVTHLPAEVKQEFETFRPLRPPAEWALRWVWDHPQVHVVLSGMSDEAQLEENLRTADTAESGALTDAEKDLFARVKAVMLQKTKIPCTGCGYCMPCPHGVDIPGCFSIYNDKYLLQDRTARFNYLRNMGGLAVKPSNASLCAACGQCEPRCPQGIQIIRELGAVSREMEGPLYRPAVWLAKKALRIKA